MDQQRLSAVLFLCWHSLHSHELIKSPTILYGHGQSRMAAVQSQAKYGQTRLTSKIINPMGSREREREQKKTVNTNVSCMTQIKMAGF
jgi:hypothetical protein